MRVLACFLVALLPFAVHGASTLRVMGFGGASNWPLFVGEARGFFEREGLSVERSRATDSATQMTDLVDDRIDIAMTAMDNVVAHGGGELAAFLGVNHGGRFRLVGLRDVASVRALKGRDVGVDATSSGYAFVLQQMLADEGLGTADYRLVSVGGSRDRWNALREGRVAATLLNSPYDAVAGKQGFRVLASSASIGHYQGSVGAARRAWAKQHSLELVAFIRAYVEAVRWLYDPRNRDAALAIFARNQPGIAPGEAQRSYEELIDPASGSLSRDAGIDEEGVAKVLELRRRYARDASPPDDPTRYYDLRYWREALSSPATPR